MKTYTLQGFGDLEIKNYKRLKETAKKYGLKLEPTYYDHMLTGSKKGIEEFMLESWDMTEEEYEDNGLTIEEA